MSERRGHFHIVRVERHRTFHRHHHVGNTIVAVNDAREEAQSALIALGYKPAQASKLVDSVYKEGMESEALIRESLKAAI